ncbi:2-keto-4-pentenoate hydratase/2-oxohepta-3-ene-1,7-dioic acid hydratase in catechol pathway [Amycolatopsis bartoniae]|uniref:2-hydroxyhepta-2,4-diene-1,7-dioate isomerase n=1 Tax=Amycolatopsis bartoniae TaxID=941986 RepID=A0A8H9J2A3_9PSEU|nr:fumarylacetoacetate hydrolase family protein [Amycolatopsis bartoniae]MBB2936080.1 2-keto-4-pentenoate hydratase/2-oxohepta-3-ene-1,7-dioic acid hydratase in catechol pathway [Amycolatopsis bartoniae]TVT03564.1 fumarylacetoacetate hydrolase family protein [Amycolatopsis bartoniae]GHF63989.1 2-hydroxyhepta-2,4-diene-1,7-dioate isomerase [Amycolatopsis bartoniae]
MRLARIAHAGGVAFASIEGEGDGAEVLEIAEHPFGTPNYTGKRWPLADVRLLAPILPSKVIAVGRNYAAHAAEFGNEVPTSPMTFLKPSTSVIGPNAAIRLPAESERVDFEGELAVVIGQPVKNVPASRAASVILGYTIANDVSARDLQKADGQWGRAKGYDTFCPLGPWIETSLDPADLAIRTELDGQVKQDSRTSLLIHKIPELVEFVSGVMTLLPGDVILTGTPEGVGPMTDGQSVSITIEGIGTLTNTAQKV